MEQAGSLSKVSTILPVSPVSLLVVQPQARRQCMSLPSSLLSPQSQLTPIRAALVNSTFSTCPSTLLTLSGYSQGAELVHLATSQLPANTTSKIASVVLFGDPKNGTALNGVDAKKVLTICHTGDDICQGGDDVGLAHLNYSADAGTAAMFALGGVAELGITSQRMKFRGGNSIG